MLPRERPVPEAPWRFRCPQLGSVPWHSETHFPLLVSVPWHSESQGLPPTSAVVGLRELVPPTLVNPPQL